MRKSVHPHSLATSSLGKNVHYLPSEVVGGNKCRSGEKIKHLPFPRIEPRFFASSAQLFRLSIKPVKNEKVVGSN